MVKRILALLIFPTAALACFVFVWWRSVREAPPSGYERYSSEGVVFLLLAPSVVLYLLVLPFVWRTAKRASVLAVASFSIHTFLVTIAGLFLTMGPLYRVIGRFDPTLADRAFFLVFPFLPVVIAITLSLVMLRLTTSPRTTAPR